MTRTNQTAAALDAAVVAYALRAPDVSRRVDRYAALAGIGYVAALRRVGDAWREQHSDSGKEVAK